jgi:hypothetical protein
LEDFGDAIVAGRDNDVDGILQPKVGDSTVRISDCLIELVQKIHQDRASIIVVIYPSIITGIFYQVVEGVDQIRSIFNDLIFRNHIISDVLISFYGHKMHEDKKDFRNNQN